MTCEILSKIPDDSPISEICETTPCVVILFNGYNKVAAKKNLPEAELSVLGSKFKDMFDKLNTFDQHELIHQAAENKVMCDACRSKTEEAKKQLDDLENVGDPDQRLKAYVVKRVVMFTLISFLVLMILDAMGVAPAATAQYTTAIIDVLKLIIGLEGPK